MRFLQTTSRQNGPKLEHLHGLLAGKVSENRLDVKLNELSSLAKLISGTIAEFWTIRYRCRVERNAVILCS